MSEKALSQLPKTALFDPRFSNQNQTRYCYQNFLDYNRCVVARGKEFESCKFYKRGYESLCPNEWIEKWIEQVNEKKFPGNI